jgi:hypothetical protein
VDPNVCLNSTVVAASGPCKAEVIQGVDSNNLVDISNRFEDPGLPRALPF